MEFGNGVSRSTLARASGSFVGSGQGSGVGWGLRLATLWSCTFQEECITLGELTPHPLINSSSRLFPEARLSLGCAGVLGKYFLQGPCLYITVRLKMYYKLLEPMWSIVRF